MEDRSLVSFQRELDPGPAVALQPGFYADAEDDVTRLSLNSLEEIER